MSGFIGLSSILVAGAVGVAIRYFVGTGHPGGLPWGLILVNTLGCLGIGWVSASTYLPENWKIILVVGLLGGLTTFSSYVLIMVEMMQKGEWTSALLHFGLSHLLGFGAVGMGILISR